MLTVSLAVDVRCFDCTTGRWADRPTVWKNVIAVGALAEKAHDTFAEGMAFTVTGPEVEISYTAEDSGRVGRRTGRSRGAQPRHRSRRRRPSR